MLRRWATMVLVPMLLLVSIVLPAAASETSYVWHTLGTRDWSLGQQQSLTTTDAGSLILSADAPAARPALGSYQRSGMFDSPIHITSAFRRVTVDYSASTPAGTELIVMVRARNPQGLWSEWGRAAPGETVTFNRIAEALQYRAILLGGELSPALSEVKLAPQLLNEADQLVGALDNQVAPTYLIRGTREGLVGGRTANGHVITWMDRFVSLPSWRSLASLNGYEYMVRLTNPANGRSAVAPVWDVGPWNRHDDYWNTDREWYKDLPVGWPEDHAAYYEGYNGGYAEVSGRVLWPAAVDVGDGTWVEDLGIAYNNEQATLYISFLWQGSDPGPATGPGGKPQRPSGNQPAPAPAPAPAPSDGSVVVDNLGAGFTRNQATWYEHRCGEGNHAFWTYTTTNFAASENVGTWTPALGEAGVYDVYAYVPYCINGKRDTSDARYLVQHADGSDVVSVNQAAHAGTWVLLGRWRFEAGSAGSVQLGDIAGDSMRSLWYDSMKWVPVR